MTYTFKWRPMKRLSNRTSWRRWSCEPGCLLTYRCQETGPSCLIGRRMCAVYTVYETRQGGLYEATCVTCVTHVAERDSANPAGMPSTPRRSWTFISAVTSPISSPTSTQHVILLMIIPHLLYTRSPRSYIGQSPSSMVGIEVSANSQPCGLRQTIQ